MGENLNRSGATRVNILREVEGNLQRLQTDYIDLYQVHGWDSNTPLEETLRTLDDLVRQGKVRDIGLFIAMSWQVATAVTLQERLGLERCATAQMYYSLGGRGLENEFQSFAEYHNIGILCQPPAADFFRASTPVPIPPLLGSDSRMRVPSCPSTRTGLSRRGCAEEWRPGTAASPARVAIAWLLGRRAVSSVLSLPEKPSNWTIISAP